MESNSNGNTGRITYVRNRTPQNRTPQATTTCTNLGLIQSGIT